MKNKSNCLWLKVLVGSVMAGFSACVFSFSDDSQWIEFRVFEKHSERPVGGAAVCLGTTARPDQFGAKRSDKDGVVRFQNLTKIWVPLLATVSKPGFKGRKQLLEPLDQSRVMVLRVAPGGGGAECQPPADLVADDSSSTGLTVDRVDINPDVGAPSSLLVSVEASGPVNQIRISERADFADASWQSYQPAVSYTPSEGKGLKQIHVQVRRVSETPGASIEVASTPRKVQYRLR